MSNASALERTVFEAYRTTIEDHVKESHYTDALEELTDFVRDCCPSKKREAIGLYSRYSRWKSAQRQGLSIDDNINNIVKAILDTTEEIASVATITSEYKLETVGTHANTQEPPTAHGQVKPATRVSTSNDTTQESAPTTAKPATRQFNEGILRDLASQPLDHVRQVYLKEWRQRHDTGSKVVTRCKEVGKDFGEGKFRLEPLSFDLVAGEITGLIGMNASGKTTLLRLLLGELAPSTGTITYPSLSRRKSEWLKIRNQIALVSQLPNRWHGRLRNNLNYTAAVYGSKGKENNEHVDWLVHRYGLKEYEDATWDKISGGYKIRFDLVRALLTKPKLLLLDEPLAYLDIVTQQIFLSDVRSISSSLDNPIPIVFTSQHLYEIEAIANNMIILDDGKQIYCGPLGTMPHLEEYRIFEIAVRSSKKELLEVLRPVGLKDIEVTMTSYILTFGAEACYGMVIAELIKHFDGRLSYFRDITRSTRSLFRNKRDDIARIPESAPGLKWRMDDVI